MKKIACSLICFMVLFAAFNAVLAESIDLSGMSYAELDALQERILSEMKHRPEWKGVLVPAGTWTVGTDIPEGEYSISMVDDTQKGKVTIWGEKIDDYVSNGGCVYPLVFGYEYTMFGKIYLKSGYVVNSTINVYFCPPVKLGF